MLRGGARGRGGRVHRRGTRRRATSAGTPRWCGTAMAEPRKVTLGAGTIEVRAPRVDDRRVVDGRAADVHAVGSCRRTCGGRRRWPRCCRCCTCTGCRPATSETALGGAARRGRGRAVADGDRAAGQGLGGRVRGVPAAGPGGPGLRLRLGGRGPLQHPPRRRPALHAGRDRGAAGRDEGGDRGRGWVSGEHRELADAAARPEAAGDARPGPGGRRTARSGSGRRPGTSGPRRGARPAGCIGSPTCWTSCPKRLQPKAKRALHAMMYAESRAACLAEIGRLRGRVRRQVPQGGRVAHDRPGAPADPLRLPGRALGASADDQPDRVDVRDRQAPPAGDQGRRLADGRPDHGVQAADDGRAALATAERAAPRRPGPGRRPLPRRPQVEREHHHRGDSDGCLIMARSTTLDNISSSPSRSLSRTQPA